MPFRAVWPCNAKCKLTNRGASGICRRSLSVCSTALPLLVASVPVVRRHPCPMALLRRNKAVLRTQAITERGALPVCSIQFYYAGDRLISPPQVCWYGGHVNRKAPGHGIVCSALCLGAPRTRNVAFCNVRLSLTCRPTNRDTCPRGKQS